MHRPRNPANRRWWLAVFVVAVAAVIVVRIFRPVHPEEPKTEASEGNDASLISTQVLSFHLDNNAELDSVADESGSIFLKNRPERPGAPIVHSDPSPAQMDIYKKERDLVPTDGAAELNKPGVKIEVE
ncbi:MAG TPA: hypothetical protein VI282_07130 [Verrucomicrobiae bacterium]